MTARALHEQRSGGASAALVAALALTIAGCEVDGKSGSSFCGVKPTVVSALTGAVVDASTGWGVGRSLAIEVRRYPPPRSTTNGGESEGGAPTAPAGETVYATVADADGAYRFSEVTLEIAGQGDCPRGRGWNYQVVATDPTGEFNEAALWVQALVDGPVEMRDLSVERRLQPRRGRVTGQLVEAARRARAVRGVTVSLAPADGTDPPKPVRSEEDGSFVFEDIPLIGYTVTFGAPDDDAGLVANGGAVESASLVSFDEPLELHLETPATGPNQEAVLDLGRRFMVPATGRDDVRVMLSWEPEGDACDGSGGALQDLDLRVSLPGPDCEVNYLAGRQVDMAANCLAREARETDPDPETCPAEARASAISPVAGFAVGTCYWPSALGGQGRRQVYWQEPIYRVPDDRGAGCVFDEAAQPAFIAMHPCAEPTLDQGPGCLVAALDNDSRDGRAPELLTLVPERLTPVLPEGLGYYYEEPLPGGGVRRRYPVGVAEVSVGGPGEAPAVVQVFEGDRARPPRRIPSQAGAVLLIELGYYRSSPTSAAERYHRLVWTDELVETPAYTWTVEDPAARTAGLHSVTAATSALGAVWAGGTTREPSSGAVRAALWRRVASAEGDAWSEVTQLSRAPTVLAPGEDALLVGTAAEVREIGGGGRGPVVCADSILALVAPQLVGRPGVVYAGTSGGLALIDLDAGTCVPITLGCEPGDTGCTPLDPAVARRRVPLLAMVDDGDALIAGSDSGGLWAGRRWQPEPDGLLRWDSDRFDLEREALSAAGTTPRAALDFFGNLYIATGDGFLEPDLDFRTTVTDLRAVAAWRGNPVVAGGQGVYTLWLRRPPEPIATVPSGVAVDHLAVDGDTLYAFGGGGVLRVR